MAQNFPNRIFSTHLGVPGHISPDLGGRRSVLAKIGGLFFTYLSRGAPVGPGPNPGHGGGHGGGGHGGGTGGNFVEKMSFVLQMCLGKFF